MDISQVAHPGGVADYTQNLAENLTKINALEMIFFYSSLRKPYSGNLPNVLSYPIPPKFLEIILNQWRIFGIDKLVGKIDIFHSSDWIQPKTKAKKVTTYHDLIPLKFPQWSHPKIVRVHRKRLELVEREVDMVIAVSQSTKKDLLDVARQMNIKKAESIINEIAEVFNHWEIYADKVQLESEEAKCVIF